MTIVAGILSRCPEQSLSDITCDKLLNALSHNQNEEVQEFRAEQFYLAKLDIGAYGVPAYRRGSDGSIATLTGEPLFSDEFRGRDLELELLHNNCLINSWEILTQSRGVYSAVVYQPQRNLLTLVVDKLGIRPIYCWLSSEYAVFASALHILEDLPFVPKKMDMRGVSELAGMGSPLEDRTPYADVFLLNPGELIQVDNQNVSRRRYWRFDDIEPSDASIEDLSQKTYQQFRAAINRRLKSDTSTVAYLSGGLDSRCVVAALAAQNVQAHTFNFAIKGTQDEIFGNSFAKEIGTIHTCVPRSPGKLLLDLSLLMSQAWSSSVLKGVSPPEHPNLVWSGEGGSVGLGHVHLSKPIIDLQREGKTERAVQTFLQQEGFRLPVRLFCGEVKETAPTLLQNSIREQLERIQCADVGRRFYLFLMFNDQRRKFHRHFESIDSHRIELQLPFFDSDFVNSILEVPIDWCLDHKFYTKFLSHFNPVVVSVPWQAYPGHDPCPVEFSQDLPYQWEEKHLTFEQKLRRRAYMNQAGLILSAGDFPTPILRKRSLMIAAWANYLGLRNYEYVIEAAQVYHTYWKRCSGTPPLN
jgi:asparagine synthase (glutamine-hydrolysing)